MGQADPLLGVAVSERPDSQPPHESPDNDTLNAALARHAIDLTDEQILLLDRYAQALWEWNEKLNLTRHTTYEKFVSRDVVDAHWLEQFLDSAERMLDVYARVGAGRTMSSSVGLEAP